MRPSPEATRQTGSLADRFDVVDENDEFGKKTWEEAEAEMQRLAFLLR